MGRHLTLPAREYLARRQRTGTLNFGSDTTGNAENALEQSLGRLVRLWTQYVCGIAVSKELLPESPVSNNDFEGFYLITGDMNGRCTNHGYVGGRVACDAQRRLDETSLRSHDSELVVVQIANAVRGSHERASVAVGETSTQECGADAVSWLPTKNLTDGAQRVHVTRLSRRSSAAVRRLGYSTISVRTIIRWPAASVSE